MFDTRNSRILICDDDSDIRGLVEQILVSAGYQVTAVESAKLAVEHCKDQNPDLIIMDIMMPEMSGGDFLLWFKHEYPNRFVPILFLTALSQSDDIIAGLDLGADDYLTKPFHHRELRARVQAFVRLKRLSDKLAQAERQLVVSQLAGAAAHRIGQSLQTLLLQCNVLEKKYAESDSKTLTAIKKECAEIQDIVLKLERLDANKVEDYVTFKTILSLDASKSEE